MHAYLLLYLLATMCASCAFVLLPESIFFVADDEETSLLMVRTEMSLRDGKQRQ